MRNLKTLGLLAIAAMALAAFVGTATASASEFVAGEDGAAIETTTTEKHVFTVTDSDVECDEEFSGVTESGATQTVNPKYVNCKAFGFNASVDTAGCSYTFKAETDEAGMATVNLSGCTAGGVKIKVSIPFIATCEVFVPNQSINSAVGYTNNSGSVLVNATATSISAEVTKSTGLCPLSTGSHSDAEYFGQSEVSGNGTTVEYVE
jgi:hypothetical protein